MRTLYRSRNGRMIHREGCRYARPMRQWLWAEHRSAIEIIRVLENLGYSTCKVCDPLGLHSSSPARGHLRVVR